MANSQLPRGHFSFSTTGPPLCTPLPTGVIYHFAWIQTNKVPPLPFQIVWCKTDPTHTSQWAPESLPTDAFCLYNLAMWQSNCQFVLWSSFGTLKYWKCHPGVTSKYFSEVTDFWIRFKAVNKQHFTFSFLSTNPFFQSIKPPACQCLSGHLFPQKTNTSSVAKRDKMY